MNLTDETVEKVGQFITKHPINTRDYTFGEVAMILQEYADGKDSGRDSKAKAELGDLDNDTVQSLFGKYGKGSLIDNRERSNLSLK
jgi:hypothetical protein